MSRRNAGQFKKGQSGNPSGRSKARRDGERADGWMNDLTGFGIMGRDKTLGTVNNIAFSVDPVSAEDAMQFWRGDDIAARVIETIPNECVRQGWEICVGDDEAPDSYKPPDLAAPVATAAQPGVLPSSAKRPTKGLRRDATESGGKELQETVSKTLQDIGMLGALREAMCYERAYGGGAILIGANDYTTDLREPLDLDRVRSLDWLTPLEPRELVPRYYYNNPRAPKFGQPAIYMLMATAPGASVDPKWLPAVTEIHESRLIVFPGIRVSRRLATTNTLGWGDSILTRIVRALRDFNNAHQAAAILLSDFSQAVIKLKGLAELIAQDGPSALMNRMTLIDMMRSVLRAIVVDADGEDFERKSTPMAGFADTVDRLSLRLAAACDMPLTLLMGQSPAGLNATGESDIRFFYDRVSSVQELRVGPAILRLVEIALAAMGEDPTAINHSIRFKPLWQPTEKEVAESHYTQAQADGVYLDRDVVSPEEIALSRFGGDRFSYDTRIDFGARAAQEAIVAPTVEADPKPIPPVGIDAVHLQENGPIPEGAKQPSGAAPVTLE